MTWWEAVILGLVEGVTEYLPVSSTGHLILTQRVLGLPATAASNAYAICIQAGAILAVLGLYRVHIKQIFQGWLGKVGIGAGHDDGFRLGFNIIVAFLPAAVLGLLFDDWIEEKLFGIWPIVAAWGVGGAAILVVAYGRKSRDAGVGNSLADLSWQMALAIGTMQCLAMLDEKIEDHNAKGKKPALEGETGYRRPALHDDGSPVLAALPPIPTGGARPNLGAAFAAGGAAIGQVFSALRGNCFPDAAILNSDGLKTFADFKFPCPNGHPSGRGTSTGTSTPTMSPRQQGSYDALGFGTGNGTALTIYPKPRRCALTTVYSA